MLHLSPKPNHDWLNNLSNGYSSLHKIYLLTLHKLLQKHNTKEQSEHFLKTQLRYGFEHGHSLFTELLFSLLIRSSTLGTHEQILNSMTCPDLKKKKKSRTFSPTCGNHVNGYQENIIQPQYWQIAHTFSVTGLQKKLDQLGSVCINLNSNTSFKQSLRMFRHN